MSEKALSVLFNFPGQLYTSNPNQHQTMASSKLAPPLRCPGSWVPGRSANASRKSARRRRWDPANVWPWVKAQPGAVQRLRDQSAPSGGVHSTSTQQKSLDMIYKYIYKCTYPKKEAHLHDLHAYDLWFKTLLTPK